MAAWFSLDPVGVTAPFHSTLLDDLVAAWRRVPVAYIAYSVAVLAQALSFPPPHEPMIGLSRYLLPIFPLFMGPAARLSGRRTLTIIVLGVSAVLLAVFSGLWAYWALVP